MTGLPVLGWKEEASLPEWGIERLRVKLDTGAKTSAIHAARIEVVDHYGPAQNRLPVVRLVIPLSRIHHDRVAVLETPVVGYKSVRDTGAKAELRPVVQTLLRCGPIRRRIDITVTDRTGMIFRMILGRQALEGTALVDAGRSYTTVPARSRPSAPRRGHPPGRAARGTA